MSNKYTTAQIVNLVDLTLLDEAASEEDIRQVCKEALQTKVAAVCVLPEWVSLCKEVLQSPLAITTDSTDEIRERVPSNLGSAALPLRVKICTVANFPNGDAGSEMEVVRAIHKSLCDGADEVDIVIPYREYVEGNLDGMATLQLLPKCKQQIDEYVKEHKREPVVLKAILETGELAKVPGAIQAATRHALGCNVDFVKTSTGKVEVGATPEAVELMCKEVLKFQISGQVSAGIKVSGGVKTRQDATSYLDLICKAMGDEFVLSNKSVRIGSSSLVRDMLNEK